MTASHQYSIPELASRLAQRAEPVARHLLPSGKRKGNEWCIGSVRGEKGTSLKIHLAGAKAGVWKDFASGYRGGDLVELWCRVRELPKKEALKEICSYLGIDDLNFQPCTEVARSPARVTSFKPISAEYHQSLRSRLEKNERAMAYLMGPKRGLEMDTIRHFGLGLSQPYPKNGSHPTSDAVVAPMRSPATGQFLNRTAYICVPDVTQNPISSNGWMKGEVTTYWADRRQEQIALFVCEGHKDVWRHWQALSKVGMTSQIMLISSTHGSAYPEQWKNEQFWSEWETIYLGQDNDDAGNEIAEGLLDFLGREAHRIKVPTELGKDWTDFWQTGGDIEIFKSLLKEAPVASATKIVMPEVQGPTIAPRPGRYSYRPVDINGAYVNGHLYYPTETHLRTIDPDTGTLVERRETIVIRSDRTVHRAFYAPAPRGTPLDRRVLKLTDGTVIEKELRASSMRTWDFESIDDYVNGKAKVRTLAAIMADVLAALRLAVWLPYDEDYVALALAVPVTYVQSVFESVPLLLLNGPAGSGKTQTGNTMAKLCANGTVIGQVSAASAARLIDETRGFIVLDDVESIAARSGKDVQVNELVQALKVSYNKHTAKKVWTDIKTMRPETLDFYGVKLLNNTLGTDSILGSRMIRIQTRKMPNGMNANVREYAPEDLRKLHALQNELHVWAFEQVCKVESVYREVYATKTDRQAEIAAPLRTIARIIGNPEISGKLESCLARQDIEQHLMDDDPVTVLEEAVRNIIKQGYDKVTVTHIQLEMRSMLDSNYGMRSTTDIPEWDQSEWIGRQLRSNNLVQAVDLGRRRIYGKNLRLVQFAPWILNEVTKGDHGQHLYVINKSPEDFCLGCTSCPYRTAGCALQTLRQASRTEKTVARSLVD